MRTSPTTPCFPCTPCTPVPPAPPLAPSCSPSPRAGAFSAGVPATFHANFLAGQAFLAQLEGLCPSRAAVDQLRGSDAWAAWAKRWNLSVYFSLIYQDIAGEERVVCFEGDKSRCVCSGCADG